MKKIISNSLKDTQTAGKELATYLPKKNIVKNPPVISLEGDLGGGKTTFAQGFAMGLLIKDKIKSPTFVIMKKYDIKCKMQNVKCKNDPPGSRFRDRQNQNLKLSKFKTLYHFDCYRINNSEEILKLGWKKIIDNPKNIILVEWGEKIEDILPENTLHIEFDFVSKNKRKIIFKNRK